MSNSLPFDAADWIERFKAVGGGFMDTTDHLHFCWVIEGKPLSDNIMARLLYQEVIVSPAKLAAVRACIDQSQASALSCEREFG